MPRGPPSAITRTTGTMHRLTAGARAHRATFRLAICCARDEAATVDAASFLQARLEPLLGGRVYFDAQPIGQGRRTTAAVADRDRVARLCRKLSSHLVRGIADAQGLVLLQTARCYTNPVTLLELYWAARQQKPTICLRLEGQPYDFEGVRPFLTSLEANLFKASPTNAELLAAWLDEHMISFARMAHTLANYVPVIITLPVPFSPHATENQVAATLLDIADRLRSEAVKKTTPASPALAIGVAHWVHRSRALSLLKQGGLTIRIGSRPAFDHLDADANHHADAITTGAQRGPNRDCGFFIQA